MEDEVFERDYSLTDGEHKKVHEEMVSDFFESAVESGFLDSFQEALNAVPKIISPKDRNDYEDLLERLDEYAARVHGKIRGVINYQHWYSYIDLEVPFLEFAYAQDFLLLADIALTAHRLSIRATGNDWIHLKLYISYFTEIYDPSHILGEMISQNENMQDYLEREREEDKQHNLSDPWFIEALEECSIVMGMETDALYDLLDEAAHGSEDAIEEIRRLLPNWDDD